MTVRVQDNPDRSRFEIYADDEPAGFATYRRSGQQIAVRHTEIDDRFEGQGLGSQLAQGMLDAFRRDGLQVLPFCPFTATYIKEHQEYLDLVPEDRRAQFDLD